MKRQPYPSRVQILEGNLRAEHQLVHRLETQITELKANHLIRLERLMSDNRIYARMLVNLTLNVTTLVSSPTWAGQIMDWILDNAEGESRRLLELLDQARLEFAPNFGDSGYLRIVSIRDVDERWVFSRCEKTNELEVIQAGKLVT